MGVGGSADVWKHHASVPSGDVELSVEAFLRVPGEFADKVWINNQTYRSDLDKIIDLIPTTSYGAT